MTGVSAAVRTGHDVQCMIDRRYSDPAGNSLPRHLTAVCSVLVECQGTRAPGVAAYCTSHWCHLTNHDTTQQHQIFYQSSSANTFLPSSYHCPFEFIPSLRPNICQEIHCCRQTEKVNGNKICPTMSTILFPYFHHCPRSQPTLPSTVLVPCPLYHHCPRSQPALPSTVLVPSPLYHPHSCPHLYLLPGEPVLVYIYFVDNSTNDTNGRMVKAYICICSGIRVWSCLVNKTDISYVLMDWNWHIYMYVPIYLSGTPVISGVTMNSRAPG